MKSAVEKLSPTRVKLSIEVPFTELAPHISGAYKSLSEKINIPGFRKGKVPAAMIDQRVGRGAVLDEAINAALPTLYSQAAKENDVLVIGRPNVEITELKDNESLAFTVEVDIKCPDKAAAEELLLTALTKQLDKLSPAENVMLKLTLPEKAGLYSQLADHPRVVRVVALSGGYTREHANEVLAKNPNLIASFSRALTEGLTAQQSDSEFDAKLDQAIAAIYKASVK